MGCVSHNHRDGPKVCIGGEVYTLKLNRHYYLVHVWPLPLLSVHRKPENEPRFWMKWMFGVWGEGNRKTGPLEIERDIDLLARVGWNYDSFLNSVLDHNQGFLSNSSQTHFRKNTQCMFARTLAFTVQHYWQQSSSTNGYGAVSAEKMSLFCHLFQTALFCRCSSMTLLQILRPRRLPSSISGMLRSL